MSLVSDTHGRVATRLQDIKNSYPDYNPAETAIIILGDAGFNFWLNKTDTKVKQQASDFGYTIYCVRGNHEERPSNLPKMYTEYDSEVDGFVWLESEFPLIRYFFDGDSYNINGYSCLVIGGAYSVDKWYRLERSAFCEGHSGWFESEQLTEQERKSILTRVNNKKFDFVFTHTCPFDWEPIDLFLRGIDQTQVDKSMETWLNKIKDNINWGVYCFGHYHADRLERPHVEQFYMKYEDINTIWQRWQNYDKTGELDWWLPKSPNFYMGNNK